MSSWKKGTTKQYDVYFDKWTRFCVEQKVHPIEPTIIQVMEFCTHLFEKGLAYSTINTARCALSAYVHKIERHTVDLFASRLTHNLDTYYSWHPDPGAEAMLCHYHGLTTTMLFLLSV